MMDFHCKDAGMNCDFVARGASQAEVLRQARDHAQGTHHMQVTTELEKKISGLIHDESSPQHQQSMKH